MSLEVSLPPSLPDDAAKSDIPSTPNIQVDAAAKILEITISSSIVQSYAITNPFYALFNNPFSALVAGVLTRTLRAGVNPYGVEFTKVPVRTVVPLVDDEVAFMMQCTSYLYFIYQRLVSGETSLPYHPRNIGFYLNALARNRIVSVSGNNTLVILELTGIPTLTQLQIDSWANFFRMRQLSYDVVNVPVFESGAFPSSSNEDASAPVTFNKISLSQLGSSYTFYELDSTGQVVIYDCMMETVQPSVWWMKAALAFDVSTRVIGDTLSTWKGICVHPLTLTSWIAYADTVCDVPYVLSCTYPYSFYIDPVATPSENYQFETIVTGIRAAATASGMKLDYGIWGQEDELIAINLRLLTMFVGCIYSPFGAMITSTLNRTSTSPFGSGELSRVIAFIGSYRGPGFFPSILHESFASLGETTIMKSTQYGVTRTFQIFNLQAWPGVKATPPTRALGAVQPSVQYTPEAVMQSLLGWESTVVYRRFLKLNMFPEYKVNKAIMPYFFMHVPYTRPGYAADGKTVVSTNYDGLVTPYSIKYVEDHNFQMLGRTLIWPRVFQVSQSMLEWFPIIDLVKIEPTATSPDPTTDFTLLAYLSIDSSYLADGCEIDDYLRLMRSKHLGFFAALAALAPSVIGLGTSIFKAIVKPKTVDKTAPTEGEKDDQIQTGNMAKAGISMLQQTTNGSPGSGGTLDLSKDVQVDPIDNIIDTGKRFVGGKRSVKMLDFAGKALRIGRTVYRGHKNNWK